MTGIEVFVGVFAALLARDLFRSLLAWLPRRLHVYPYRWWSRSLAVAKWFGVEKRWYS